MIVISLGQSVVKNLIGWIKNSLIVIINKVFSIGLDVSNDSSSDSETGIIEFLDEIDNVFALDARLELREEVLSFSELFPSTKNVWK